MRNLYVITMIPTFFVSLYSLIICIIQITHEERKNARRDHRMKESGYGSDRASSDRQV